MLPPDAAPVIEQFVADPDVIFRGDETRLRWRITGLPPMDIRITTDGGSTVFSGTDLVNNRTLSPGATTTYTIEATNAAGTASAMEDVTVNPPRGARIFEFSAAPASTTPAEQVTLTWRTENANRVLVVSAGGGVISDAADADGTASVSPMETTTYTLTAFNVDEDATANVTVTVTPIQPVIDAFSATPTVVAASSTTTLAWSVQMAEQIRILADATELVSTSSATGTLTVAVPTGATTYTLEATNPGALATRNVEVVGVDRAPVINTFTALPLEVVGSATATVTWDVDTVSQLGLFANGQPVASFPAIVTSSITQSQGTLAVPVSGPTTFALVADNVVGRTQATQTVAWTPAPIIEIEPNDTASTAQSLATSGGTAVGQLTMMDVDWYAVTVPAGGNVFADVDDGAGGCGVDAAVTLFAADGTTALAFDDNGGVQSCPRIDPALDAGARNLPAGRYFLQVSALSGSGSYTLNVRVTGAVCGNGIVETRAAETCDDADTIGFDGCSATCQLELGGRYTAPGPSVTATAAVASVADVASYGVTVTSTAFLSIATFSDAQAPACTIDTQLTLLNAGGATVEFDDDDGLGLCAAITNRLLGPGAYTVVFNEAGNDAAIGVFDVVFSSAAPNVCGNGVLESGEDCDDGNQTNSDGCSASCSIEGAIPTEVEPNNTATTATALAATATGTIVRGTIPVGDVDFWSVTLPSFGFIGGQTYASVNNRQSCAADTVVDLLTSTGTVVTRDDDGGFGTCSRIDTVGVPGGTYALRVRTVGNGTAVRTPYILDVFTATVTAPATSISEVEPNDAPASAQAIALPGVAAGPVWVTVEASFTSNDRDVFSFTVPPGLTATVVAATHGTAQNLSSCSADTVVTLEDALGTPLATGDDNAFGTCGRVEARLSAGTYSVSVRESAGAAAAQYFVSVIVL